MRVFVFDELYSFNIPVVGDIPPDHVPNCDTPDTPNVPPTYSVVVGDVIPPIPTEPLMTDNVSVNEPLVPYPIPTRVDDEYVMICSTLFCAPKPYPVPDPLSKIAILEPVALPMDNAHDGVFVPIPRQLLVSSQNK